MKKLSLIFLLVTLMICRPCFAGSTYVGADIGVDHSAIRYELKNSAAVLQRSFKNEPLNGLIGGLNLGYSYDLSSRFTLGFEGDYHWSNSEFRYENPTNTLNINDYRYFKKSSIGLSLTPGLHLTDIGKLYAILGWVNSQFKRDADAGHASAFSGSFDKNVSGYRLGVGNEIYLMNNVYLRMQYLYSHYSKISNSNTASTTDATYTPTSNDFMLGVSYHFNDHVAIHHNKQSLPMNHLYFNVGAQHNSVDIKTNSSDTNDHETWPHGLNGFSGVVGLGYGALMNRFYLGVLAFSDFGDSQYSSKRQNGSRRDYLLKKGFTYGISVMPGYALNPSNLFFMRLGWVNSQFKKTGDEAPAVLIGPNYSVSRNGFMSGLGFETTLSQHVSLVSEYDYITYGAIENSLSGASFQYKPNETRFMLGINYRL